MIFHSIDYGLILPDLHRIIERVDDIYLNSFASVLLCLVE